MVNLDAITDNGIYVIRGMLMEVNIAGCSQLTNECIPYIKLMEGLKNLNLNIKIWDVGGLSPVKCWNATILQVWNI